jgi:hypothetical protein
MFLENLKVSRMTKSDYIRTAVTRPAEIDAKIALDQLRKMFWDGGMKVRKR